MRLSIMFSLVNSIELARKRSKEIPMKSFTDNSNNLKKLTSNKNCTNSWRRGGCRGYCFGLRIE
jgi:hypothetical protein